MKLYRIIRFYNTMNQHPFHTRESNHKVQKSILMKQLA